MKSSIFIVFVLVIAVTTNAITAEDVKGYVQGVLNYMGVGNEDAAATPLSPDQPAVDIDKEGPAVVAHFANTNQSVPDAIVNVADGDVNTNVNNDNAVPPNNLTNTDQIPVTNNTENENGATDQPKIGDELKADDVVDHDDYHDDDIYSDEMYDDEYYDHDHIKSEL